MSSPNLRVPVKIAQERLGHASIQTTLNIYTHVVDASHRAAIESLKRTGSWRLFGCYWTESGPKFTGQLLGLPGRWAVTWAGVTMGKR